MKVPTIAEIEKLARVRRTEDIVNDPKRKPLVPGFRLLAESCFMCKSITFNGINYRCDLYELPLAVPEKYICNSFDADNERVRYSPLP